MTATLTRSSVRRPQACPPRFGTPRSLERATLGPAVARVAELLGRPLMPWQRHVADVVLEVDPGTGRLAYSKFILTVPRQSGKSTFIEAKAVHRCSATSFFGDRQHIIYTAQSRQKAKDKWYEDYVMDLQKSRVFSSKIRVTMNNGMEQLRFANGSRWGIESNKEDAGHGSTLDEAYIDEAFSQKDSRLEQAFRPAMITRANKQLGVISTAGWDDDSPYFKQQVDLGRVAVQNGARTGVAYFEWSAPDGSDPTDRDLWWRVMPALGHTITEDAIAAELADMGTADFARAYLNMWVPKAAADSSVIPAAAWSSCLDPSSAGDGPLAFGVDVTPDRSSSSIAVAAVREDGRRHVDLVDVHPGTEWVVPRLTELVSRWDPCAVVLDRMSPAAALLPEMADRGIEPVLTNTQEMGQACGAFFDDVVQRRMTHSGRALLDDALTAARKRRCGDAWAWDRKGGSEISPLVAATLARWAVTVFGRTAPPPPPPELLAAPGSALAVTADLMSMAF